MSKYRLAGEFSRMFFLLTKNLSVISCHWIGQYSGHVMIYCAHWKDGFGCSMDLGLEEISKASTVTEARRWSLTYKEAVKFKCCSV